ncbi:helix-turn-helix domain-containing protein [Polaribacter sp.]|uniref:helix-turn-helix domain-containing protein n=1 Tax=Polaribacter sp. TaxID=1920175 RepID=UPI003EF7130F
MNFEFLDTQDSRGLINNFFCLTFEKEDLPFKSVVIPTGFPSLVYIFSEKQKTIFKKEIIPLKELTITGLFDGSYSFYVNDVSCNLGINLHPTTLYKILNTDISLLTNKHIHLKDVHKELFKKMNPLFVNNKEDKTKFTSSIIDFIENLDVIDDMDVIYIDKAIDYIYENEGMLHVTDLLKIIPFSQKSLEIKFKKIIGVTPGKFLRMTRFTRLMRKYENNSINIKDLIFSYNYYDYSHFIKDFKMFMSESPKAYFKKEYPFVKAYSKNL